MNKHKVPNHIYCGRGSALGNPYIMRQEIERDSVCDAYENWFYLQVNEAAFLDKYARIYGKGQGNYPLTTQEFMLLDLFNMVVQGQDINLGCFCAPKRCHCDTVKTFLDHKLEELMK